jgi:hypothetical protein
MKCRPKTLILGALLLFLAATGPGLADTLEIGDPSVTVSTSSITLNGSFTVGSASSGTFAPYSGTAGTLSNIDLLSTTPVNAPLNVPNFVALTGAPNLQIGLNFIAPGVGSISFGCQAASQTCTPSFPALISPADPLGLSPLTFMNTQFGSVASFNVVASGSDTLSPGSTSSTLIGTVTTQYAVPYQTVVSQMISGDPISSSYSATFNAASGATAGALQVGAPTLSISRTGIDFLPASGGTGSFDIGGTSSATFTSLGSAVGTIKDLNFATAPINTLGSVPDFITLAGDPNLHFDLTFIVPGVDAPCTAPFFSESQTCTYIDPLLVTPNNPGGLSPFEIMNLSGGSMLSFEVEGLVTDDLFPGESLPFDAIFATQYDEPFQQFLADDFTGGSMDSSYSATVSIDGSFGPVAVPEPSSLILFGPGVVGLIFLFMRRGFARRAGLLSVSAMVHPAGICSRSAGNGGQAMRRYYIQSIALGGLLFLGASAHAQTTIPGCSGPNLDPTTQANCTFARELLDAYNGKVESDTSNIKGKGGNYELCYKNYNSAMASEARIWDADEKQLVKQGDKTAELDAAKKVRSTMMVITTHLQSCLAQRTPRQSF